MSFTPEEVRRLASLARLELSEDETLAFARQLGDILDFARQVQAADTSGLQTNTSGEQIPGCVLPPLPAIRGDAVEPSLARDIVLSAAPDADDTAGLFKVPRVLNG